MRRPTTLGFFIYTRKSAEEGLVQAFNSLDAEREAGEAFIASQKHLGWAALPERYDDGGFTGANMDRPALKRLLEDIEASRVDVVVVYKVDRLSRSLLDFARLIETFDRRKVSFVSVTPQVQHGAVPRTARPEHPSLLRSV
ncbi:MAG TPA: recombinase family protein [Myxococcales bacterium]